MTIAAARSWPCASRCWSCSVSRGSALALAGVKKLALLLTCARMKRTQLLDGILIVKLAALMGWHRQIARHHRTFQSKRRPGRPRTDPQEEQLVLRLARGNTGWGCGKIAGEMRKLGFVPVSGAQPCSASSNGTACGHVPVRLV